MKQLVMVLLFLLLLLGAVIGLNKTLTNLLKEEVDIQELSLDILQDIQEVKDSNDQEEHVHSEVISEEFLKKNQDPSYVAQFFFAAAILNDLSLFSSVLDFEQYNSDLFLDPEPDKMIVGQEILNRITRNQTLEKIKILSTENEIDKSSVTVNVRLIYKDLYETKVKLTLFTQGTNHEHGNNIFFVKTSVWELIEIIEKG